MNTRRGMRLALAGAGVGILVVVLIGAIGWERVGAVLGRVGGVRRLSAEEYERWARQRFERRYPGEKPLNWRIAEVALEMYESEPMGRFVLQENDCSDFVGCVIDEALGAGARFRREGDEHLLCGEGGALRRWLFEVRRLPDVGPVQPGDVVSVRHSPHYPPHDESIGHVGVVGPEGSVMDFCKLKSWSAARYGRHDFEWFIRNCKADEVRIGRLRPQYRYRVLEIERP
ncbi:MAG: hypothetical protein U9R79_13640 [Armatimonadota bacterium]|nr:hypothetical protein [Armatimonadota bacterium]